MKNRFEKKLDELRIDMKNTILNQLKDQKGTIILDEEVFDNYPYFVADNGGVILPSIVRIQFFDNNIFIVGKETENSDEVFYPIDDLNTDELLNLVTYLEN